MQLTLNDPADSISHTIQTLLPHVDTIGITRIADITGLDCLGIPTVLAIRPNAKHLSVSVGKGVSLDIAKVSAIMECMELFHLENPMLPVCESTYHCLGEAAISPGLFNPGFFHHANLENQPLSWTIGINLLDEKKYYIPHDLINLDSTQTRPGLGWFEVSTNGMGAGNTFDDAICHGLYEVIERHSLQAWKRLSPEKQDQAQICSDKIDMPISASLLEKFRQQGFQIKVWDIANAFGVSVFHCAVSDTNPFRLQGIFRGSGAHLSTDIALTRALTEVAQSRLSIIAGSRDDIFPEQYRQMLDMHIGKQIKECLKSFSHIELPMTSNATKNQLLQNLAHAGFSKIININHTKDNIKIPVIQIIIPGMKTDLSTL